MNNVIEEKKYDIDEVFCMIGEEYLLLQSAHGRSGKDIIVDGFRIHPKSLRYMTFYQKGVKCVCCGKMGTHFRLCGEEKTNRRHFNLYADDGTLITKDHIIPVSKGGRDDVENMQPMCKDCNEAKGNQCDSVKVEYIVGRNIEKDREIYFRTIEKAALSLTYTCGKVSSDKVDKQSAVKIAIRTTTNLLHALESGKPYCEYIWTKELM